MGKKGDGWYCRIARSEQRRKEYAEDPEQWRDYWLNKRYDITVEEYDRLEVLQEGVCAICEQPCKTGRKLAVDHCHETKRVRALLCASCNRGIGMFGDNLSLLKKAVAYLETHAEVS